MKKRIITPTRFSAVPPLLFCVRYGKQLKYGNRPVDSRSGRATQRVAQGDWRPRLENADATGNLADRRRREETERQFDWLVSGSRWRLSHSLSGRGRHS